MLRFGAFMDWFLELTIAARANTHAFHTQTDTEDGQETHRHTDTHTQTHTTEKKRVSRGARLALPHGERSGNVALHGHLPSLLG